MTEKDRHFTNYPLETAFDEMFDSSLNVRETYERYRLFLNDLSLDNLQELQTATDQAQRLMGMTFQVHGDERGLEKVLQLDIIPRIIADREWKIIEGGLRQRIKALNLFIQDIYHGQKILKDDVVPEHLILTCPDYLKQCKGLEPPRGIWIHITGTDIVRDAEGTFRILEDNLRCPSGVSYMLENRKIIKATFPNAFDQIHVQPVNVYPQILHRMLEYIAPASPATIVVLTPGIYNSAFYEHSYLAQEMGVELVEGNDLVVKNDFVYMRTTAGLQKVDVIYRRIDDKFLDPVHFNSESMLGVPGLFDAYRKGHVALANAPGTGVADDKAIYPFVPDIIKYYLSEEPILSNIKTYNCAHEKDLEYVLENISDLVVKETNAAGGYGMLIGPKSSKQDHDRFRGNVKANPRNYIAQPMIDLSTVPSLVSTGFEPRHVDLRPFIIYGQQIEVIPGGLTRVALRKGSLVVNSSQGGGTKDTWVTYD